MVRLRKRDSVYEARRKKDKGKESKRSTDFFCRKSKTSNTEQLALKISWPVEKRQQYRKDPSSLSGRK